MESKPNISSSALPPNNIDREIEARLAQARERHSKLLELARLEKEITTMEHEILFSRSQQKLLTREIVRLTAIYFKVDPMAIMGRGRPEPVATARQIVMHLMREKMAIGPSAVGELLNKNHGTVIHGCHAVKSRAETIPSFRLALESLTELVDARIKELEATTKTV